MKVAVKLPPSPDSFQNSRRFTCGGRGAPWRCRLPPTWLACSRPGTPNWLIWTQLEVTFASKENYHRWVLKLCGVLGDAVAAKAAQSAAIAAGTRIANPYTYKPAFKNSPSTHDLSLLHRVFKSYWGTMPKMLDPTAGGGSIPYEAARYGIAVTANDLNSVAACILRAGVEMPTVWGLDLTGDLRTWGDVLVERMTERLGEYFPSGKDERVATFLFARTVRCPRTGKTVPLAPHWWISKEAGNEVAVRLLTHRDGVELDGPEFELLFGKEAVASHAGSGTASGGDALSPWDGLTIDGDYLKVEAKAGRLGCILYAVVVRRPSGNGKKWVQAVRSPTQTDIDAVEAADKSFSSRKDQWLADGVVPSEEIPMGNKTKEPLNYGMLFWYEMFSPRQCLVHGTFVEEFERLIPEVRAALPAGRADAILGLLALMQGKALNYNALQCIWDYTGRDKIAQVFSIHGFPFKYAFAEFEGARELYAWSLDQIVDSYKGIAALLAPSDSQFVGKENLDCRVPGNVQVTRGSAGNLATVENGSQTLVCIDPPYYDNVMYAELSDFFGVWEQHTVGEIWPDLMPGGLADVKNEAVANVGRFTDSGRNKKNLAVTDYEAKMQAIFAECNRVLRDDGVLTVMFTHKRAEAWDTLGMALMQAGFSIETSWPVNTESEQSLHQAKKNSAASTIMLVCRKREDIGDSHPYFEDLEADVRSAARDAVERFSAAGISGVDLLLSTYGPALAVVSSQWPVYSSEADESGRSRLLRPEEALNAAREEVVRLQRTALIGRPIDLDPLTDFVLLSWSTFKAVEFPFDEARRLALAVGGLDVDELVADKILKKKSGTVVLTEPKDRLRRKGDDKPGIRTDADSFAGPVIDAVHTVLYVADVDGLPEAKALIDRTGLAGDSRFMACIQGLVNAIPRTKNKGQWVRPEAGLLDDLVTAYFPDIETPEEWTGQLELDA